MPITILIGLHNGLLTNNHQHPVIDVGDYLPTVAKPF